MIESSFAGRALKAAQRLVRSEESISSCSAGAVLEDSLAIFAFESQGVLRANIVRVSFPSAGDKGGFGPLTAEQVSRYRREAQWYLEEDGIEIPSDGFALDVTDMAVYSDDGAAVRRIRGAEQGIEELLDEESSAFEDSFLDAIRYRQSQGISVPEGIVSNIGGQPYFTGVFD